MQLSTLTAVLCLVFSIAMASPTPQGFISQEKCIPSGSYTCGAWNNIYVCNSAGKWQLAASCGSFNCQNISGVPHCI